jgi:glutamate synthase domain-containing protein 2
VYSGFFFGEPKTGNNRKETGMKSLALLMTVFGVGFGLTGLLAWLAWRPVLNLLLDAFIKRLLSDPYPENLGEMYNVFKKIGPQNVLEADLRANDGKPLARPFGSPRRLSQWDQLLLNPVYLSAKPIVEAVPIDLEVKLGPRAKRPLAIKLPIVVGGMGYGFGPSYRAKLALAKAATQAGTATNTGVGPFLPEERQCAQKLIIQYHRGAWGKDEAILRQADMVEIQLGYGALGAAPVTLEPANISPEFREYLKITPGAPLVMDATLTGADTGIKLAGLVAYLRRVTNGVPIGVKIGATHHLEAELTVLTAAGVDFLSIDGAEAGINFGSPLLADACGLPTLPALCRTVQYLQQKGLRRELSIIISGGLATPGQFLKALALGADAVSIGTVAIIALAHTRLSVVIPWEPPTELVYERGKYKDRLCVDEAARSLANYLQSCREEMELALRSLGKTSLKALKPTDLCALSPQIAALTGVESGLTTPQRP